MATTVNPPREAPDAREPSVTYESVPPHASSLVESLRAFGYSPAAALADLIDNSITARANNVWIRFFWAGLDSFITVLDDGAGMTEEILREAMRPGTTSPLEERDRADLGRFGLGLKTASFSQCRRLTVRSKTSRESPAVRAWDLDYVGQTSEWRLLTQPAPETHSRLSSLDDLQSGTIVAWEKMDRLVGSAAANDDRAHRRFLSMVDDVEAHIGMVFHRFLSGAGRRTKIWINDREVAAWDPYMQYHPATQALPAEKLFLHGSELQVSPYVLPHHSRLDDAESRRGGGPQGWNAQQGFYVYRNNRLLVAGSWLGLGFAKEEHYKLARIAVDLPNTMDHDWDINVTKSKAVPPGVLRDDMLRIARATRERAVNVYRHRGQMVARATSEPWVFVWLRSDAHGKITYRINREHPLVKGLLTSLDNALAKSFQMALRLVEETVPVPTMVVDSSEHPDQQAAPFDRAPSREVLDVMRLIYQTFRRQGVSHQVAVDRLSVMEPFNRFPELLANLDVAENP
jgi:hypothetical protein